MSKLRARSTTRFLSIGLVLALLILVSDFSSAQTREVATSVIQVAKLTASGGSVSISGDTVVIGDWSGSAYVFDRNAGGPGNWGQVAKLTASDGAEGDAFGVRVSISGDTVVVGADLDDDNGDASGSAYLFEKPEAGWTDMTETVKLIASDGAAEDHFGRSVSISGETVVVGAIGDDDNGDWSGSAYVFERDEGGLGNWGRAAKLFASDGSADDSFGLEVSISGDIVVAGAHLDDDNGDDSGSAYVFEKPVTGWPANMTETVKLTASDGAAEDWFGHSVSSSGDTLVACAAGDDPDGSAYVFLQFEPVAWVYLPVVLRDAP